MELPKLNKHVANLQKSDFDAFGFALIEMELIPAFYIHTLHLKFYTTDRSKNIESLTKYDNFVELYVDKTKEDYKDNFSLFQHLDIVGIFSQLIHQCKNKKDFENIFKNLPSCIYENKEEMMTLFRRLPKDAKVLESIKNIVKSKKLLIKGCNNEEYEAQEKYKELLKEYEESFGC